MNIVIKRVSEINKKGFSLFFIMLITSSLFSVTINYWHMSHREAELVNERIEYEKLFRLTEGGLFFGIQYAKEEFEFLQKESFFFLDLSAYSNMLQEKYYTKIIFRKKNKSICIAAVTEIAQKTVCCLQCCLQKKQDGCFVIDYWKISE